MSSVFVNEGFPWNYILCILQFTTSYVWTRFGLYKLTRSLLNIVVFELIWICHNIGSNDISIRITRFKNRNEIIRSITECQNCRDVINYLVIDVALAKLGKKGDVSRFTQEMKSNKILNFTNVIDVNMKTFLIALSGT